MGCLFPVGRNGCVGCAGCALPLILLLACLLAPLGFHWLHGPQNPVQAAALAAPH